MKICVYNTHYVLSYWHEYPNADNNHHYRTECRIKDGDDGKLLSVGAAQCSAKDHFCRAVGRKIALARAIQNLFFSKEDRAAFWRAVWQAREQIAARKWTV